MPTPEKEKQIEEIKHKLESCTIAIATGYTGMSASDMNNLRSEMRGKNIEYVVVKNTLTLRAASEIGKNRIDELLDGPTGVAFGYDDIAVVAKGLNNYINTTRLPLVIHGAMIDNDILESNQVIQLASLPPKDELIAKLLGQMQSPITGLVYVLSAPYKNLAVVLQRRLEQIQ
jgi:large subunit ribosomal protein L10